MGTLFEVSSKLFKRHRITKRSIISFLNAVHTIARKSKLQCCNNKTCMLKTIMNGVNYLFNEATFLGGGWDGV